MKRLNYYFQAAAQKSLPAITMTSAFQLATNVMEIGIAVMGQMNTIAQSIVSGMNGVTGVAVLPHVEEDHNLLQGQY